MEDVTATKKQVLDDLFLADFHSCFASLHSGWLVCKKYIFSSEITFAFLPLAALIPISAALILTYKESGWGWG